MPPRQRPP
uniref:Uncharacterized protein n=1 Tax=Arundo donax TaxID=35708 RepID=A0A0A9MZ91_ARUDO